MQRRCQSCGAEVSENAKFCRGCGGRLEEITHKNEEHLCLECGKGIPPRAKFCRHCGIPISGASGEKEKPLETARQPLKPAVPQEGIACSAPEAVGESVFPAAVIASAVTGIAADPSIKAAYTGPIKVLFSGGWHLLTGFFAALKSPGKLMPGFLLGLVWLIVSTLPALGITLPGQDIASWLTFAQGGMQGGTPGAVGGVLGKGVFAAVLTGLFTKNSPKGNAIEKKNGEPQRRGSFGLLLIGNGVALILFNFFTWDNSVQNSMIGVVAALGTLRAMGRESGFLRRLVTALAQRFSPKRMAGPRDIGILGAGLATGFALSVPMSLIAGSGTGYIMGVAFLLPGMLIAARRKIREAVKSV